MSLRSPLIVLLLAATAQLATAQTVWRCGADGRQFSDKPCEQGRALDALEPRVLQRCVFAHGSAENGHARWLQALGVQPLLDLGLRLGEGSGAALAWPLLESACRILAEMASFESAGVSQRDNSPS